MAALRKQYAVSRPVYSEDGLAGDHEMVYRRHKPLRDHLREYLT